jgi:hypothetical protein
MSMCAERDAQRHRDSQASEALHHKKEEALPKFKDTSTISN